MENKHPNLKAEKAECSEDMKKSVADLVKGGMPPGKAVAEARKKHGVDAGTKHKATLKPLHLKKDDEGMDPGMADGGADGM